MVGVTRFEHATTCSQSKDSTRLSYKRRFNEMERVGRGELRIISLEDCWAPLAAIYPHCWHPLMESNHHPRVRSTVSYPLNEGGIKYHI